MLTPEEINQIRQMIRDELRIMTSKQVFERDIQILDNRHIQVGRTRGTIIGTATDQKIGFYGKSDADGFLGVVQAGAISSPSADVNSLKTAVDAIRTALTNLGITA